MNKKDVMAQILHYIFSLLSAVLALIISLSLRHIIGSPMPSVVFFGAIMLSAWYSGLSAGIVTTIISSIVIGYFFLNPPYSFSQSFSTLLEIAIFTIEGCFLSFFIHIGKRQDNARDYRKKEKEYTTKMLDLERKYELAQTEIRSRDEFLSIASHELKTPLTSMLLQIQTALHNIRSVSLAQFSVEHLLKMLESAENQTKRLSRMITDLLNVSLMTTGRMDLELEEVNLSELVHEVIEDFSEKLKKDKYKLDLRIDSIPVGSFDKVRIEQAISNILSNAIKYGKGNPITVSVSEKKSIGKIVIQDQGIGIPEKELRGIFALFQRAVSENEYKGLGVGLYITHQIVKAHGGTISVQSKEGKGSSFIIELPLQKNQKNKLFS